MILVKSYKILVNILQDLDKDETRFVPFRKDLRGSLRKYGKFLVNLYKFSSTHGCWELLEMAYSFNPNYGERMRMFLANNTTIFKMHKAAE